MRPVEPSLVDNARYQAEREWDTCVSTPTTPPSFSPLLQPTATNATLNNTLLPSIELHRRAPTRPSGRHWPRLRQGQHKRYAHVHPCSFSLATDGGLFYPSSPCSQQRVCHPQLNTPDLNSAIQPPSPPLPPGESVSDCMALPETSLESEARGRNAYKAGPGEQVRRNYGGRFANTDKFGVPTPMDKLGSGVKSAMSWSEVSS